MADGEEGFERFIETESKHEAVERAARASGLGHVSEGDRKDKKHLGLCGTCANATITTRGQLEHHETTIMCRVLDKVMPPDIMECSSYWKEGQMTLRDMGEIAWVIDPRQGVNDRSYR